MENTQYTNPILPAPGVSRIKAKGSGTGPVGQYYDDDLNSTQERAESDMVPLQEAKLVRCKKEVVWATLNVRTIREEIKAEQLVTQLTAKGIDIIGIQEHHIGNDEEVRYRTIKGQFLITSTTWRSKQQAACGGVGVVLSHREKSLRKVKAYSKRIMIIEFVGNPVITIIVAYSSTNVALEER